jgi:DNA-binding response OmpR family regulator
MKYRHYFPFVVEDDEDFALLLQRALLKAGVPGGNVRRYRDGEGALADLVSVDVLRPSVLLLDMDLPGMTGLSVLERVRACERLVDLPAFVLSGRDDGHMVRTAQALGARGYWMKPHSSGELLQIVRGMLGSLNGDGCAMLPGNLLSGRC